MNSYLLGYYDDTLPNSKYLRLVYPIRKGTEDIYFEIFSTFNFPLSLNISLNRLKDNQEIFYFSYPEGRFERKREKFLWPIESKIIIDKKHKLSESKTQLNKFWIEKEKEILNGSSFYNLADIPSLKEKEADFSSLSIYVIFDHTHESFTTFYFKVIGILPSNIRSQPSDIKFLFL